MDLEYTACRDSSIWGQPLYNFLVYELLVYVFHFSFFFFCTKALRDTMLKEEQQKQEGGGRGRGRGRGRGKNNGIHHPQ